MITLAAIILIFKNNTKNYDFNLVPEELINDYRTDEASADKKYKGKPLRIKGRIESLNTNSVGDIVINLRTNNQLTTVKCRIDRSDRLTAANYVKDEITLIGKGDGIH